MTDSPTPAEPGPVEPDVELASAHLDGEAGTDERARTDDAAVQAQLSAFSRVAEQVRDVPAPPAGLLDDHVARAMEAFDGDDRVVPLQGRRPDAQAWWQRIPLGAVAAALVLVALVAGAVGLASTTDGDDDADTATAALEEGTGGERGEASAATGDSDAMAGTMEEGTALESDEQLDDDGGRRYDSYDALAEDLRAELAPFPDQAEDEAPVAESDAGTTAPERSADDGTGADPCRAVELLGLDPASVVLVRPVTVASEPVTVVVHDADGGRRLTAVDEASCSVVDDRLL